MSCDYSALPHLGIRTLHPYIPGKSVEELAQEQGLTHIIKMASNENPLGCSVNVLKVLSNTNSHLLATYPSAPIHPLRKQLSEQLGIEESMLMLSNGSDLLFAILLKTFALHTNKHILTHEQAFISYQIQAQTLGIPYKLSPVLPNYEVDIDALIADCNENTGLLFIANPNNPTGIFIQPQKIAKLLASIPSSTIVVVDEAYYEFAYPKTDPGAISLLSQYSNVVITRTFSKAYGLAGLRLGYAIAHPDIIQLLLRVQLPFAVNQLALAAGVAALDDAEFVTKTLSVNEQGKQQMHAGFDILNLHYLPSVCNFVTVDCGRNALPIYQDLLQHGIIVRPLKPYNLPNHLRVSIGEAEHNNRFLKALTYCLKNDKKE